MLAQNFKTANELRLTDKEHAALIRVLGMLEREEIKYCKKALGHWSAGSCSEEPIGFNMYHFFGEHECGTVACIAGWAVFVGGLDDRLIRNRFRTPQLENLFDPCNSIGYGKTADISTTQAATALRSYLTTGESRWDLALAPQDQGLSDALLDTMSTRQI